MRNVYKYNESGFLTEFSSYNAHGKLTGSTQVKCDEKGNPVEKDTYIENNVLSGKLTWEYDAAGRKTTEYLFGNGNKIVRKTVFTYDKAGLLIQAEDSDPVGNLMQKTVYKYDGKGRETEHDLYKGENMFGKITYEYDEDGNIALEMNYNYMGQLHMDKKMTFDYDKRNNITEERNYNGQTTNYFKTNNKYSGFDREGNWQKQVTIKNMTPKLVTERDIDYY